MKNDPIGSFPVSRMYFVFVPTPSICLASTQSIAANKLAMNLPWYAGIEPNSYCTYIIFIHQRKSW